MDQETSESGKEQKARQRARIILEVRSGRLTATQGAAQLGISRQRFYEWEQRALAAMTQALEDGDAGRPAAEKPLEDPEKEKLKHQLAQLEQEVTDLRRTALMHDAFQGFPEWRPKPGEREKKRHK